MNNMNNVNNINLGHASVGGRFRLEKFTRDSAGVEHVSYSGPWFSNLITEGGLNVLSNDASGPMLETIYLGTGTTPPTTADTALASYLVSASFTQVRNLAGTIGSHEIFSDITGVQTTSPYRRNLISTREFPPGWGTGIISEIGVGNNLNPASAILLSRELIRDGVGNPTTIEKLADEFLRVFYDFGILWDLTDKTGSIVLDGISYNYTMRPAFATSTSVFSKAIQTGRLDIKFAWQEHSQFAWDGPIGTVTTGPSGTSSPSTVTVSNASYIANSFTATGTYTLPLSQGNFVGGINSIVIMGTHWVNQIGFVPNIPKQSTQVLTLTVSMTWGRI